MKIIDSFIFYNELKLLNYRLSILDEHVDYFILVESTHTFSGHSKKLFYDENKSLFKKFNHKIIHIVVTDFPYKYPNINYSMNHQWLNEYHQRNSIKNGIKDLDLSYSAEPNSDRSRAKAGDLDLTDIILTSDVDEIPDPRVLDLIKQDKLEFNKNTLNRLALDMYYYNLNFRVGNGQNWHGIKLMTYKAYKEMSLTFQQMRIWEHSHPVPIIPNGGWHLSYFGDVEFIMTKIKSFSHQEYNNEKYIDKNKLEENIKNGINFIGGLDLQYIDLENNKNLPPRYKEYLL